MRLASLHNVYFYLDLMEQIQRSIEKDEFSEFKIRYMAKLANGCEEL